MSGWQALLASRPVSKTRMKFLDFPDIQLSMTSSCYLRWLSTKLVPSPMLADVVRISLRGMTLISMTWRLILRGANRINGTFILRGAHQIGGTFILRGAD